MMKLLITFLCFLVFAFSFETTLNVVVEKDKPFIGEVNPSDIFGDVTIDVEGKFDKDLIVCLQEITNPPFRNRYTDCTFHFELKPEPVTTTGAATTGAATTATAAVTTAAATTSHATTGASTTHDATTAAVTTAASTTHHATTGAATTHHATTAAVTTAAAATTHHATTTGATTHHATTAAAVTTATHTTAAATTHHATTAHTTTTTTSTGSSSGPFEGFKREAVRSFKLSKRAILEAAGTMFPLRNVRYSVGVYFKAEPTDASKQTFNLKFSAKSCEPGKTGPNCEDDVARWPGNTWLIFEAGKTYYYNYTVDSGLNTLSISTSSDFSISARFSGVPFGNISDATVANGKIVTLLSPRAGNWFIVLSTATEGNSTVGTTEVRCPGGMAGTGCGSSVSTGVNATSTHVDLKLNASQIVYYSFVGQLNTLLVSARTVEVGEALKQPELYAGFNRAPQFTAAGAAVAGTYDVSGCNVESCKVLTQINLRGGSAFAENGTWYVAVKSQEAKEMDHLFWIDFVCPGNCSNTASKTQGTCQTTGADLGVCKCQPSYSADLLCSEADFLVEYIILIVIAALVAISAIIGLVAWAYMKSKHRGYEPV